MNSQSVISSLCQHFLGLLRFHTRFLAIEFACATIFFLFFNIVLSGYRGGEYRFSTDEVLRFAVAVQIFQLTIRVVIGNYVFYYLIWNRNLNSLNTYLLSIGGAFSLWLLTWMFGAQMTWIFGGELGKLARWFTIVHPVSLSIIGGILIANWIVVATRKNSRSD